MLTLELTTEKWKKALQAADDRYHAVREAVVYAEATEGDPEMIKRWKGTLWNCPESEWPDLTREVLAVKARLAKSQT